MANENLGPAERIINMLTTYADHMYHGRPGVVVSDNSIAAGAKWNYVTTRRKCKDHPDAKVVQNKETKEIVCKTCNKSISNGPLVVYKLAKQGKKEVETRIGVLENDKRVTERGMLVGQYREPGLFEEVAAWMYEQVVEVWRLDNEFAAKWASYAFRQEHKDMKVVLAAFMLCQSRKGDPVVDGGKVAFYDDDFRDVGEAMFLTGYDGGKEGGKAKLAQDKKDSMRAKDLLRAYDLLALPKIVEINRKLGFCKSAKNPFFGRWESAVRKWLRYREENQKLLEGLVKSGQKSAIMELSRRAGYVPESKRFFEILGWKQKQAADGHRKIAIGEEIRSKESWAGYDEQKVCEAIIRERPNYKRAVGLIPKEVGLTRSVVMALIEAGGFSDKELVIFTPTLESLGLLEVQEVEQRWQQAVKASEDMRAANIASRVKTKEVQEKLQEGADVAVKKVVEEATRGIRVYFMVDISGSMQASIPAAIDIISKFFQGFPPDRVHAAAFTTAARELTFKAHTAAGVRNAFSGVQAGGGTDYGSPLRNCLEKYKPAADEDVLFFYVGDEQHNSYPHFADAIRRSGLQPAAFALIPIMGSEGRGIKVRETARQLGIPCFEVDIATFVDPYAIPRTMRNLIASTPVGVSVERQVQRETLIEIILKTQLLQKPAWAA
ncbi:MAG TPA: vWA domain-containing protein [Methylobacter sp.]